MALGRQRNLAALLIALSAFTPAVRSKAGNAPRATKGPYLTGLCDRGVDVRFELDVARSATVKMWPEGPVDARPAATRTFEGADESSMHVVDATDLDPATHYEYVVIVQGAIVGRGRFTTAPTAQSGAPLTFLVSGDERSDPVAHAAVTRAMMQVPSDFLIDTGDVVEDGGSAQDWQTFFDVASPLLRDHPMFMTIGNHELYDDRAGANFARYLGFYDSCGPADGSVPKIYGSVRLGNLRLFFMNGMHDYRSGEERQWLESALARSDGEADLLWRIAVVHHGPWSSGPHGGNAKLVDARVPELLAAHKVDLVLSGHDHIYERGEAGTLKYIVSGGGGAPLYRVTGDLRTTRKAEASYHFVEVTSTAEGLRIIAHRLDGTTLERCGFRKGGPWDCDPAPPVESVEPSPSGAAGLSSRGGAPSHCGCEAPGARAGDRSGALVLALTMSALIARRVRRGRAALLG